MGGRRFIAQKLRVGPHGGMRRFREPGELRLGAEGQHPKSRQGEGRHLADAPGVPDFRIAKTHSRRLGFKYDWRIMGVFVAGEEPIPREDVPWITYRGVSLSARKASRNVNRYVSYRRQSLMPGQVFPLERSPS